MLRLEGKKDEKLTKKIWHCACCGRVLSPADIMLATVIYPKTRDMQAYVCDDCMNIQSYHTDNNNVRFSDYDYSNYSYSFELESVPNGPSSHGLLISREYRFIATRDGSLPFGGVEFKTPIYPTLHGLKQTFKTFAENVNCADSRCGSHINIGHVFYINKYMDTLRANADTLFMPLANYMYEHKLDTINVCGRYFTHYACMPVDETSFMEHTCFINLTHDTHVEFRISKFVDAMQYFWLANMWHDVLDCIFKNLDKGVECDKIGQKVVKIFIKYAAGKAPCQAPHRNKA